VGELTAASLAGVLSREHAVRLAVERGRAMEAMEPGAMLAVGLSEHALREVLPDGLELAAANGPELCTVAGPGAQIEAFEAALGRRDVPASRLHVSHAFHSAAMAEAAERFAERVARIELRPPELPYLSNLTGDWANAELATDPASWGRHVREPVRFAD